MYGKNLKKTICMGGMVLAMIFQSTAGVCHAAVFSPENAPTVCIDAGHDAHNTWNASPDGKYLENEFALDMDKRIKSGLEKEGVKVIETRPDGQPVTLGERCRISNREDTDLFVSLHSNAAAPVDGTSQWTDAKGWECLVYSNSGDAGKAAQAVTEEVGKVADLRSAPIVERPGLYVLHNTDAPAMLIEHGFHTNRDDTEKMLDDDYRQQLAEAEVTGVVNYLSDKMESADQTADEPADEQEQTPVAVVPSAEQEQAPVAVVPSTEQEQAPVTVVPSAEQEQTPVAVVPSAEQEQAPVADEQGQSQADEAAAAVQWAVENGILKGYNNGDLGTGENLTREQFCVMLYRYNNIK